MDSPMPAIVTAGGMRTDFIITRDGRKLPISVTPNILRDADGMAIGAVEFFRDRVIDGHDRHGLRLVPVLRSKLQLRNDKGSAAGV